MTRQANPVAGLSRQPSTFKIKTLSLAVAACLGSIAPAALANPNGAAVASGSATFATQGNTLTVTNSNGAIINWQQFNIGANETTRFVQPNAQSSVLNRVVGADPSQILGTLQSNGQVFLINPNGIVFGRNSIIDVPGLIASTLNLSNADFLARKFSFSGGGFGPLINQGRISTPLGGSVMLIGSNVRNEGVITTPQGQVVLAAGNSVSLIDTAGPELSVTISANGNKAVNLGEINAAGGRIDIFGALIEQQGVLRADSASVDEHGRIILKATESTTVSGAISATNSAGQGGSVQVLGQDVTLTGTASIDASGATGGGQVLVGGDWQGKNPAVANAQTATMQAGAVIRADATDNGNGGKVVLWSERNTDFKGSIFARGGANGGNGGQVETSGHALQIGGTVDTRAPKGAMGFWLLDPAAYCFDDFGSSCMMSYPSATYVSTAAVAQALQTSSIGYEATDFIAIYNLTLNNASFNGGYTNQTGATLGFKAPHIGHFGTILAANPLHVHMMATGSSVTYPSFSGVIKSMGSIITRGGEIQMDASNYITLGSGSFDLRGTPGGFGDNGGENLWDIYLRAPAIVLDGKYVYGSDLYAETNALKVGTTYPATPLNGQLHWAAVVTYTPGTNVNVGMVQAAAACATSLCITNQLASPQLSITEGATVAAGRCTGGPSSCDFSTVALDGDVTIGGFGAVGGGFGASTLGDVEFIGKNIILNQGLSTPSGNSHILLFAAKTFTNNVGPSAINTSNGGTWSVVIGEEAGSNFNGLTAPKYSLDLTGIENYDENDTWPSGNAIFVLPTTVSNALTDPCLVNPTLCAVNNTTTATADQAKTTTIATTTTTSGTSTPTGALTVDSTLTVSSSSTTSTGAASTTTSAVTQTSTTQEAKLAVTKQDSDKSVGEVQAEAKAAKESATKAEAEAKRADAEAKQAEAEAKQAEADAKAAKTPAEKAAAKQRAEAKKAEAEGRKAEAEAKKAEAEAKMAEAESREALAEAKSAPKTGAPAAVAAKQSQAEGKQAQAEAKQAEAQARKAEAESKQAAIEAKSARTPEQKAAAQKTAEAKKIEAEAHKTEAQAKKIEAEAKQAEAEAKTAATPQARAVAEKRAETKRTEAEVKKTEAESKQAQAEGKQAEAQGKQAEVRAKEAQAEAKQAEAEVKAAKTPEQKLAATQKAEVKKTEAEAHKTEGDARKVQAEGKKIEAEAKKAEAEVKKAEAEVKQAKAPEQKAAAEKRVEAKRADAEVKKTEAEAKHTEADAKQAHADAKMAEAEAKGARSAGGRAVVEKEADAKRAEGEHKLAEAAVKKAEAVVKKAEAVVKKAEAEGKKTESLVKKAEAEVKKAEAEIQARKAEADKKRVEAEKKVEEHRIAMEKRQGERRAEAAKAFSAVVTAGANRVALENLAALRHELKTETLKPALNILKTNPSAADLPPCGAGSSVCIPVAVTQQASALTLPPPPVPKFAALPQIQRKVAVVIGVNKYADPSIPSLESAVPDAQAVGQQLQEQLGYDVRVIQDASRADIVTSLNKLSQEVGPDDSVTVYYAGHGYLSEKTKTGYWIPADAKVTSPDNWISNNDIGKLLSNIPAKQVMLVSDSCYSGSLTKEQKIAGAGSLDPAGILAKRSVTVMSSGGEEPVSDEGKEGHSIFAYTFMSALKSVKQVDSGAKLFENVRNEVAKDFPQTPQYGGAVSAGHAPGGDYLFETRSYK